MKDLRNELIDKLAYLFNHLEHEDDEVGSKMVEDIIKFINSDAQAESPTVGDNEDKKKKCDHMYAFLVKDGGGLMQCSDCGECF